MHWWEEKREEGREKGTKKGKNQKFFKYISVGKEMQVVLHIQNKNDFFSLLYILKSQGHRSLVGGCLWGRTESDMTEVT